MNENDITKSDIEIELENLMWDKILTTGAIAFLKQHSGDVFEEDGKLSINQNVFQDLVSKPKKGRGKKAKKLITERPIDYIINDFFRILRENTDYKTIVVLSTDWNDLNETRQVNLAIHHVGVLHASRFMILMDYTAYVLKKGELK